MNFSERWTFKPIDAEVSLPSGEFARLEQALILLDAKSSMHREPVEACTCIRCASDHIQRLAVDYNRCNYLSKSAPRAKHVIVQAELIADLTNQLLDAIFRMDDYSRKAFIDLGRCMDFPAYRGWAEDHDYPDDGADADSLIVQTLRQLLTASQKVSDEFKKQRGVARNQQTDRGGNTNLYKEIHGSADRNLVIEGWAVFARFRPKQAKGTTFGIFHEFLKAVFQYATGLDPESNTSIESWMKGLASSLRKRDELIEEQAAAVAELQWLESHAVANRDDRTRLNGAIKMLLTEVRHIESKIESFRLGKKAVRA